MNMIGQFATSLVAVGAFSAVIFAGTSADSMKPVQFTVVAAADASQSRVESFSYANEFTRLVEEPSPASGPLNSKETPQDQLNDLQYN
jgi:hypothetical protein